MRTPALVLIMCIAFLWLSFFFWLADGYGNNPGPLLRAIEQVESSGNPAAIGDGGEAVGVLQIHRVLVDDVNRILGKDQFTYEDRFSVGKSREMFRIYTDHYSRGESDEVIARRWNGGPRGDNKESTLIYWEKVQDALTKQK